MLPLLRLGIIAWVAFRYRLKALGFFLGVVLICLTLTLIGGKLYQHLDRDPDRGALAMPESAFNDGYTTPVYLNQGWSPADSLWFYNTTQGSALIPYDLFVSLEQADSEALFRSARNMDRYRYLPQKPSLFNPDGLPVGFARDTYQGKDYLGFTCAACHTGQINYQGKAIRIDGGPAMADMVGFLTGLEHALKRNRDDSIKRQRLVERMLARDNDYQSAEEVEADLERWALRIQRYNLINHSHIDYGYARLDAFGRIYNRVLQHLLDREQLRTLLLELDGADGTELLTPGQVDRVLINLDPGLLDDRDWSHLVDRLQSEKPGLPGLSLKDLLHLRNRLFNEPNAPVSYPFLWDISHSDYVQWNGLANNAGLGPLGRNVGEVTGVFAQLDWELKEPGFSLSAWLSGQEKKQQRIDFTSSINLVNLQRLEAHLGRLQSPRWPEEVLGPIDWGKASRGRKIYARYCQSCHQLVERDAWDRLVIAKMTALEQIGTDPAMAQNSVRYKGSSGNFTNTLQDTEVGPLVIAETAPVAQLLTSVTKGAVATPDADKNWLRRSLDWLYTLGLSFFDNDVEYSIKRGNYQPDTTTQPYRSLLAYKARSLNGIWATAPFLHNGSVPSLYDLLLPKKRPGDPEDGEYRPDRFMIGSREFDPVKVGFRTEGYKGFEFRAQRRGDSNAGHEYAAGRTPQPSGERLPALTESERWDLVEYLKTL